MTSDLDPSTGSGQRPSTGSGQRPSTGSGQRPSTGSGRRPSTGSGQRPSTGSGRSALDPAGLGELAGRVGSASERVDTQDGTGSEEWAGDVTLGVDAWARRAAPPPPEDPAAAGPAEDAESVARKILLDQLTGQARSRKELADKLTKRNVPDEIATRLLDRFEEVGLVDDQAFARLWTTSRQSSKGLARRALAQELRRKGIADDVAREVLDELDPDDEEAAARALVQRKLRTMSRLDDTTKARRLVAMLARKGYPSGLAMAVVRHAITDMPESEA